MAIPGCVKMDLALSTPFLETTIEWGDWTSSPSPPHSLELPQLVAVSPCVVFSFLLRGPHDKALSVPCSCVCCMHMLNNSQLKHGFPGQKLSQPGFGVDLPLRLWS